GGGGDNPGNNLHVSSLALSIDERALEDHFAKYGVIDKVQIMFDPHSQESRGFAFVTMKSSDEADAAIAGLNGTDLGGKTMRVEKVSSASLPPSFLVSS
ncbi:hypothetical protein BDY24DRAFT_327305, partial [Mrakia frigida]|uniref:RNA recognition motif domain-containing protein n=1 Tax=Mrakia frigida TaxID=29902 RepID=UPI003FCC1BE1